MRVMQVVKIRFQVKPKRNGIGDHTDLWLVISSAGRRLLVKGPARGLRRVSSTFVQARLWLGFFAGEIGGI